LEATGTITRLSVHVEPIFALLALPYLVVGTPVTLLTIQALVVASGVFPAAWLARRHLALPLAQIAFPLAYLLAPPLEAATLYEFHAVTLSAAFLLWALYFADAARYRPFALFAVLAVATKEEIGLVVALMGLWIWWRQRDRTAGAMTALLAAGWSLFCVFVIIRHFAPHHQSSAFCGRFNPFVINGHNTGLDAQRTTCGEVAKLWVRYPDQALSVVWITAKRGFLHRMFATTGYLSVLSPLTLAISLPSYALILFSNDIHMYSRLAQYPAELVPIMMGAAILGTAWLSPRVGPLLRVSPGVVATVACLWLLVASIGNARVNGFTPLAAGFALPQDTRHDQIGRHILSLIPPRAAVSAGDYLNPHLSDRHNIYLFPDVNDAQYAVVDVSREDFPTKPIDEMDIIRESMLTPGTWGIVAAEDGYLLMERRVPNPSHPVMGYDPRLPTALPPAFYRFALPAAPQIAHPMTVNFGPSLQLVGYRVERRDEVNLRLPNILLPTAWRLRASVTSPMTPVVYLTNSGGAIDANYADNAATDWLPVTRWPIGRIVVVQGVPMTIATNENGAIDVDLAVYRPDACPVHPAAACDLLGDNPPPQPTRRYRPAVRWTPDHIPLEVVDRGTILKLTQVPAHW